MLGASDRFQKNIGVWFQPSKKNTEAKMTHPTPPKKNWRSNGKNWNMKSPNMEHRKNHPTKKWGPTQTALRCPTWPICPAGHLPWTFCKPANLEENFLECRSIFETDVYIYIICIYLCIPGTLNNHCFKWMFGDFQPFKGLESSN